MSEYKSLDIIEAITLVRDGCKDILRRSNCHNCKILPVRINSKIKIEWDYFIKQTDYDKHMEDKHIHE